MTTQPTGIPTCCQCQRQRGVTGMDAYDYSALQAISGQPLGWYSGDDGEFCPECITKLMRGEL